MKYQKYMFGAVVLGVFFLIMFAVATTSFALGKVNDLAEPSPNIESSIFTGVIQIVGSDSYTIQITKGEEVSTMVVKFDTNTKMNIGLSGRDRRDMTMNNISPHERHQNMNNFSPNQRNQRMNNFRGMARQNNSAFEVGDTIKVIGKTNEDKTIQAESIHKVNPPKVVKNINN